jgi:3-methyladenine DNA glycosylase AlkD
MMIEYVRKILEEHRSPEKAGPMENYMKNHFPFLGIKTPERRALTKGIFQETGLLKKPFDEAFVIGLWEQQEREYQYVAVDYLMKMIKKLKKDHLGLMEKLITTKSWWDTVDTLAAHPVGAIAAKSPEVISDVMEDWTVHENMWLRRTSIIFQLRYKGETNEEVLYRYILKNIESKEFFIQKAIGWALREYSKTNPDSVRQFISGNKLAPLSVREGSKYI